MGTIKKHSKFKNTGILFELLIRQITSDMVTNQDSKIIRIVKKYFNGTELLKEYNLYTAILKSPKLSESKAENLISAVIEESKKLNNDILTKEKYALIREIKQYYNIENFFKTKIETYKPSAALYTLIEAARSKNIVNTGVLTENRDTLVKFITQEEVPTKKQETKAVGDFIREDKDIRILAYKLIIEKYNETYSELSVDQKNILKEYINSISDTSQLRYYYNIKIQEVKDQLTSQLNTLKDKVVKIKLTEIASLMKPIAERREVRDEHIVSLMQYYELLKELKSTQQ